MLAAIVPRFAIGILLSTQHGWNMLVQLVLAG
jgi:hypothetical protein